MLRGETLYIYGWSICLCAFWPSAIYAGCIYASTAAAAAAAALLLCCTEGETLYIYIAGCLVGGCSVIAAAAGCLPFAAVLERETPLVHNCLACS
jgi:hypothetical protein